MQQYLWSKLYARWLSRQLLRPRPAITFQHGSGTNLILGVARNYGLADLRPFIRSARKHHDCRILLVINNERELGEALSAEGVDYLVDEGISGLGQPHMNFARVADYILVLQALRGQVDRVFLADTRDVIFQRDIFQSLPNTPIAFVEEAHGFSFDIASWNGNAIRRTFGLNAYEQIKHHEVICSGTVLCNYSIAITYCWLKLLLGQMVGRRHHMRSGVDQATTNIIARLDLMPSATVVPYNGAVATLSGRNKEYLKVADGLLVSATGNVPAAVHQYDHVPEIRDTIYAMYDGPKAGRAGDKARRSTIGKKLRVLVGFSP
jgi:hypothetical protein